MNGFHLDVPFNIPEATLCFHDSQVFGMGEDSVFNGNLPVIRDGVVNAIGSGSAETLRQTVDSFANEVVKGMQ